MRVFRYKTGLTNAVADLLFPDLIEEYGVERLKSLKIQVDIIRDISSFFKTYKKENLKIEPVVGLYYGKTYRISAGNYYIGNNVLIPYRKTVTYDYIKPGYSIAIVTGLP